MVAGKDDETMVMLKTDQLIKQGWKKNKLPKVFVIRFF